MSSTEQETTTGRCACGSVVYRAEGQLRPVLDCHCEPCRRYSGHHLAATSVDADKLFFDQDATLQWWFRTPTIKYGFCNQCGSSLFWQATNESTVSITAGTLDMPTNLTTAAAIHVSEAGDYYTISDQLDQYPLGRGDEEPS